MSNHVEKINTAEALETLRSFVEEHADLVVTSQTLRIPAHLKSTFYALVKETQIALFDELVGADAEHTVQAALNLSRVRNDLLAESDLVELNLPDALEALTLDARSALSKPALNSVLDALQNNYDAQRLIDSAFLVLPSYCETMFRSAYEMWVYFQIIADLKPVRFFEVFSLDTVDVRAVATGSITVGAQITSPERRIPEAVFETKDGRVFAFKSEVARELDFYSIKITRRRDFSAGGNTINQMGHRVLLLYRIEDIEKVPLLADRDKPTVLPPDLICEFLLPNEMSQPTYVSQFVDRINSVRSRRPVQVVTFDARGSFPEGMMIDDAVAPIDHTVVGFSADKIDDIASLLR